MPVNASSLEISRAILMMGPRASCRMQTNGMMVKRQAESITQHLGQVRSMTHR